MAKGVNKVIIVGNLGRDPEVRYTQAGVAVCNLRVAIGDRRKQGDDWVDHTEWVTAVAFGRTAENAAQYLAKGRQVYVEGRMQTRSYKDKEGVEKWSTDVVANELLFLSSGHASGAPKPSHNPQPPKSDGMPGGTDSGFYDDDLPF